MPFLPPPVQTSATAPTTGKTVKTSDLGATFDRVYFARPDSRADGGRRVSAATPLVGIRVSGLKLEAAILREAASRPSPAVGEIPGDALLNRYRAATAKGKDIPPLFEYRGDLGTDPSGWRPVRDVERKDDGYLILLPPNETYNGAYRVRFIVGDLIVEGDGPARYRGRFNANFSTNLVREDDTLIDGSSRPSAYGVLSLGYRGAPNPFQGFLFSGKSFSDLTLNAVLTENSRATRSSIEASSSGVADFGLPTVRGAMPIQSLGLQTSQSLRQTVFYPFAPGYRFGDLRASSGRGYLSADQAIPGVYVETALQLGVTQFRHVDGVDGSRDLTQPLVRPRVTLGLLRYLSDRTPVSITGNLTFYYVANGFGGVQDYNDSRFPETFSVALSLGPPTSRLTFGLVGGRNFAQNFEKVLPSYSLGLSVGFQAPRAIPRGRSTTASSPSILGRTRGACAQFEGPQIAFADAGMRASRDDRTPLSNHSREIADAPPASGVRQSSAGQTLSLPLAC